MILMKENSCKLIDYKDMVVCGKCRPVNVILNVVFMNYKATLSISVCIWVLLLPTLYHMLCNGYLLEAQYFHLLITCCYY